MTNQKILSSSCNRSTCKIHFPCQLVATCCKFNLQTFFTGREKSPIGRDRASENRCGRAPLRATTGRSTPSALNRVSRLSAETADDILLPGWCSFIKSIHIKYGKLHGRSLFQECDNAVCGNCKPQLEVCPMCREDFRRRPPLRNKFAERMYNR